MICRTASGPAHDRHEQVHQNQRQAASTVRHRSTASRAHQRASTATWAAHIVTIDKNIGRPWQCRLHRNYHAGAGSPIRFLTPELGVFHRGKNSLGQV